MRLLGKLAGALMTAVAFGCTATVAAQIGGLGVAWSRNFLTHDKVVRYVGVIYGFDPLALAPPTNREEKSLEPQTREQILADRVHKTPRLTERELATVRSRDEIRSITITSKRNRQKFESARTSFESLLAQLEKDTATRALNEVQTTLEAIQPKQAKEIVRDMLNAAPLGPADNVMRDVVTLLKSLPDDKLRKILGEFKSEEERKLLHQILVEIGKLDEGYPLLTGTKS